MSRFHPGAPQLRVPPPGRQWRTRRRQDNTFVMARARGVVRRELEWAPVERARERERESMRRRIFVPKDQGLKGLKGLQFHAWRGTIICSLVDR